MDWIAPLLREFGWQAVMLLFAATGFLLAWWLVKRFASLGVQAYQGAQGIIDPVLRERLEESFGRLKDMEAVINANTQRLRDNGARIQDIHEILNPERIGHATAQVEIAIKNVADLLATIRELLPYLRTVAYGQTRGGAPPGAPFPEHQA